MIDEPPRPPEASRGPAAHRARPRRRASRPPRRGGQADHLGRQVGRELQHVAHNVGQRLARRLDQNRAAGQSRHRVRLGQVDPLRPGQRAEHVARIEARLAHRQPAAAALAQGAARHGPVVDAVASAKVKSGVSRCTTRIRAMPTGGTTRSDRASIATSQPCAPRRHSKCTRLKFRFSPEIAGL